MTFLYALEKAILPSQPGLVHDWREDAIAFFRKDVMALLRDLPWVILIIIAAYILTRMLRAFARKIADLQVRKLPSGIRVQQVRTLATVLTSVGVFVILFVAVLMVLRVLGLNLVPVLASAGIVGLAIGFGAQTLVKDFINGFFILLENQYDIGDTIRIAGVQGTVERMSLRMTALRDDDGTLHLVPNSAVQIVSNSTRDWAQLTLRVAVAYNEPSDKVMQLLQQVAKGVRSDPAYQADLVSDIQVPGIDRVGNGQAEYLMLIKTRPNKQYAVGRELRQRIKQSFEKNGIQPGGPGRVYVVDQGTGTAS
jgi:moderate conductance mechanosensitive channel